MAYIKTNWANGTTPLNQTNLNKIENELEYLDQNALMEDSLEGVAKEPTISFGTNTGGDPVIEVAYDDAKTGTEYSSEVALDPNDFEVQNKHLIIKQALLDSKLDSTKVTLQTTAPTSAITDGGIHLVILDSAPATEYNGYIYLIKE